MRNFDRDFEAQRRAMKRAFAVNMVVIIALWVAVISGGVWLILNPHKVGAFFGRVVAGFNGVEQGPEK